MSERKAGQVSNEEYASRWDAIFGHDGDSPGTIHRLKAAYRQPAPTVEQEEIDATKSDNS